MADNEPPQSLEPAPPHTGRSPDLGSVHVITGSRKVRIVLTGEIDADLGQELLESAGDAESSGLPIEVDARHVTFMDSTGVAFLARLASRAVTTVVLIDPPDVVRFLLSVTKIGDLLSVVERDPGIDASLPGEDPRDNDPDAA